MADALFAEPAPAPPSAPERFTERQLLEMLHARYGAEAMGARRYAVAEHVGLRPSWVGRVADFMAQDCYASFDHDHRRHLLHGFEVKVSRGDFMRELRDPSKAESWSRYCDRWWLVAPAGVLDPRQELPAGWGLLVPRGGVLYATVAAPLLDPEPMPADTRAAFLRAVQKTATRRAGA